MSKIVQVALPVPTNQLFSYKVNSNEELIGKRIVVPFGSRILTGVVVGYDDSMFPGELKYAEEILDARPFYSESLMHLTKWISEYYMASWGETLKAAAPPILTQEHILKVDLIKNPSPKEFNKIKNRSERSAQIIEILRGSKNTVSVSHLKKVIQSSAIYSNLDSLETQGYIVSTIEQTQKKLVKKTKVIRVNPELMLDEIVMNEQIDKLERKNPAQARLFSYIYLANAENNFPKISEALEDTKTERTSLTSLKSKNLIEIIEIELNPDDIDRNVTLAEIDEIALDLTSEQQECVNQINMSIDSNVFKTFLIFGVTGSGKTLVYLHNIQKAIDSGKGVLILVPEISLTPQLIDRFEKSFAGMVSILHSKMTDYERVYSWRQIASGKAKIVLGARSALFAPIQNLGLIIVDEEHEQSYKQESPAPRYNARDAAIVRAKYENAVIVLGSATPSIESMYNSMNGKYELLNLKQRADGAEMPFVRIVDMIDSMKKGKVINSFSKMLLDMIEDRLAKNEGVILFQNRRGFSPVLICKSCAHTPECIHCSIKLTYHKSRNILKCHYCGYTIPTPNSCQACEDGAYEISGYGTQRIEQELKEYLESKNIHTNIERLDLDSTTAKDSQRRILERFYTGETSILVGTQMVAKGLNFDRVTLVGVINADIQLFMPDFRASERTFQLLTQVSGRAGRKRGMLGQVIIQTYNADNYAIKYSAAANYIGFYNNEIEIRYNSFYPPFTRFITIEFYGTEEDKAANYASTFRAFLPKSSNDIEILGPVIPTIFKMRNNFRRVIIIKSFKENDKSGTITRNLIRKALAACNLKFSAGTVMMKIDIDSFAGV